MTRGLIDDNAISSAWPERRFALAARGTTARTGVLAGVITLLTTACIGLVVPAIPGQAGMAAVATTTRLAAGFASILLASA